MPGIDGRLYLTRQRFEASDEAQEKLALARPPTGFFVIPEDLTNGLSEPARILAAHGQPGGALEQYLERSIPADGLKWVDLTR